MAKTATYKDIVLENATIIRTDFACNHHGGLYHPTIWVKVDGRSVKRLIREGYCIKQMVHRDTGKKDWILIVSASIPFTGSSKTVTHLFDSKLCVECNGSVTVFDVERIVHIDRYIDMVKVLDSVNGKINMFEKIPYESLRKMAEVNSNGNSK